MGALGKREKPFAGSVLSLFPNLSRRSPQGEDGTPSPFSKPFIGIYLFVTQIDKCPLSFEKILFNIFTVNQPILGTELIEKSARPNKSTGDRPNFVNIKY